jgi:hypothetical protein
MQLLMILVEQNTLLLKNQKQPLFQELEVLLQFKKELMKSKILLKTPLQISIKKNSLKDLQNLTDESL